MTTAREEFAPISPAKQRNKEEATTLISPFLFKTSDTVWFRAQSFCKKTHREKMSFSKNRFLLSYPAADYLLAAERTPGFFSYLSQLAVYTLTISFVI